MGQERARKRKNGTPVAAGRPSPAGRRNGVPAFTPGDPKSLPDHLPIYLTNRCNLSCSYCYVAVNQGPAKRLDWDGLKIVLDDFFATPVPKKKITFLGGEPFLDFPLMERASTYAREKTGWGDGVVLQTFTNGTLATREQLETLHRLGVHVTISLDGKKGVNDAHRKFHGHPEKSVIDEVLRRLDGLPKDNLGVSLVFTAETVDRFLENVDYFYRMGFPRITFTPELYEIWPEDKIVVLEKALEGFRRYYKKIMESGARPFQVQILFSVIENMKSNAAGLKWWHSCHNGTVGPDANFYACDKALSFKIGDAPEQITGSVQSGMDLEKRAEIYERGIAAVESAGFGKDEFFCPMGPVFYSEIAGEDPGPRLVNFHRVAGVFSDALIAMIAEVKHLPAYKELYEDVTVA